MRQRLGSLFRTTTFWLVASVAGVVVASVLALLAYVYVVTVGQFQREADAAANREFLSLERVYAEGGLLQLRQEVLQRSTRRTDMLYVLIDTSGQPLHHDIELSQVPALLGEEPQHADLNFTRADQQGAGAEGQGRGRIGRLLG